MFVSLLDSIVRNLGDQIRVEKRRAVAQNRVVLVKVFLHGAVLDLHGAVERSSKVK